MSIRRAIFTFSLLILMFLIGFISAIYLTGIPAGKSIHAAFCSGYGQGVTDSAHETGEHLFFRCGQ